jgi:phosphoserine phosphatase RsbU/P
MGIKGPFPTTPGCVRLVMRVSPENLSEMRIRLADVVGHFTADGETTNCILLALEEAVQNVIRYGYRPEELPGRLDLNAWRDGGDLVIELRDFARPADLTRIRPRAWDPSRPGGLGLRLIFASMDDVRYTHAAHGYGNVLLMRKRLG